MNPANSAFDATATSPLPGDTFGVCLSTGPLLIACAWPLLERQRDIFHVLALSSLTGPGPTRLA